MHKTASPASPRLRQDIISAIRDIGAELRADIVQHLRQELEAHFLKLNEQLCSDVGNDAGSDVVQERKALVPLFNSRRSCGEPRRSFRVPRRSYKEPDSDQKQDQPEKILRRANVVDIEKFELHPWTKRSRRPFFLNKLERRDYDSDGEVIPMKSRRLSASNGCTEADEIPRSPFLNKSPSFLAENGNKSWELESVSPDGIPAMPSMLVCGHLAIPPGQRRAISLEGMLSEEECLIADAATHTNKNYEQSSAHLARLRELVENPFFDLFCSGLVALNAILLAVETEMDTFTYLFFADRAFCVLFLLEMLFRVYVLRREFFYVLGPWNILDLSIVLFQFLVVVASSFSVDVAKNVPALRTLLVLRLLRLTQTIRLMFAVRAVEDLRTIVASISGSLPSLVWCMGILIALTFPVAICITQLVVARDSEDEKVDELFGSVSVASLTLYKSVWHGIHWGEAADLLFVYSPFSACLYIFYLTFIDLSVINIVIGVVVEKSRRVADMDHEEIIATHIYEVFKKTDKDNSGEVTWEEFEGQLQNDDVLYFFRDIDVSPSEAKSLFDLLDKDNNGSIDILEFVSGCLEIQGSAKAITLAYHVSEMNRVNNWLMDRITELESLVISIANALEVTNEGRVHSPAEANSTIGTSRSSVAA